MEHFKCYFLLYVVPVYQTAVCYILGDHDLNIHDRVLKCLLQLAFETLCTKLSGSQVLFICLLPPPQLKKKRLIVFHSSLFIL